VRARLVGELVVVVVVVVVGSSWRLLMLFWVLNLE
jgi:hypothetical protein